MSKALLIVDIDDKYSNAIDELRAEIKVNCYGKEIVVLKNETLKEMPNKADLDYYKAHFYETPIKDVSVGALRYVRAKARNEVIDEILGGNDE